MTIWEAFKAGFGFLSVIPVGITMEGIDALMKRLYMYPIVGFLLGIFIGGVAFIAEMFLPTPLTIISIILAVYSIIWFNHLDGVADMGDGMTAHGSLEKKRKALKDMSLGIGGVAFAVLLILAFYSSLYALENAAGNIQFGQSLLFSGFFAYILQMISSAEISETLARSLMTASIMAITVIIAETCGKQAMLTIATFGKSFQEGLGSMTIAGGTRRNFIIGMTFTASVSFILLGLVGFSALIASTLAAFIILKISNRHFEGLNGDGIGISNEAGRVSAIAAVAVIIHVFCGGIIWML